MCVPLLCTTIAHIAFSGCCSLIRGEGLRLLSSEADFTNQPLYLPPSWIPTHWHVSNAGAWQIWKHQGGDAWCSEKFLNECISCVFTPTSAAEWVCLFAHKVDFVWPPFTGRNFKIPALLSCRFDLAGCCMPVYECDFFHTLFSCWSRSPLAWILLFEEWPQCLGACPCVDQVTQSIFFLSPERRLVPSWWFSGKYTTLSLTALFAKPQIITWPSAGSTCLRCFWPGLRWNR